MIAFFKKLNFEQKVVLLLVILFMAFIPLIVLSPYFQGSPATYQSGASEPIQPAVEFTPPPPVSMIDIDEVQMQVSAEKRAVGTIQTISPTSLDLTLSDNSVSTFVLNNNTLYIQTYADTSSPDSDGFTPLIESPIAFEELKAGMQVEVAWQESGPDLQAVLVRFDK